MQSAFLTEESSWIPVPGTFERVKSNHRADVVSAHVHDGQAWNPRGRRTAEES